jgi:hypothetical protein
MDNKFIQAIGTLDLFQQVTLFKQSELLKVGVVGITVGTVVIGLLER